MIFEVKRGYAEHEGALHTKGSSFGADPEQAEVKTWIQKGIIAPLTEPAAEKTEKPKTAREKHDV